MYVTKHKLSLISFIFAYRFVLTEDQVELYIVHWGGFLLDLTVGFVMITATVRPLGVLLCVLFNAMNSRMFAIGETSATL